jgi:hypothetical protein
MVERLESLARQLGYAFVYLKLIYYNSLNFSLNVTNNMTKYAFIYCLIVFVLMNYLFYIIPLLYLIVID